MSISTLSKTTVILIGFLLLSLTSIAAFAKDSPDATAVGTVKKRLSQEEDNPKRIKIIQKEKIEDRVETIREKLASKTAVLKAKLETFKDKKKAEAASRLNTNLNMINQNQTAKMQRHLNTMSGILGRLEERVNKTNADIKDPVAAKAAITSARAVIATASAAVSVQAQKDYTIQVTSEGRIKSDAKLQRDKLHTDLQALRKTVINAKQTVSNTIRIAKSGSGQTGAEDKKEGTSSGKQ
ncbi:hypothetical protein HYU95_04765 [Candidatus Daviesbacteria bacterium]|nr:hypothetical protein [Candidatus Daviesbacteria bacterium]